MPPPSICWNYRQMPPLLFSQILRGGSVIIRVSKATFLRSQTRKRKNKSNPRQIAFPINQAQLVWFFRALIWSTVVVLGTQCGMKVFVDSYHMRQAFWKAALVTKMQSSLARSGHPFLVSTFRNGSHLNFWCFSRFL